MARRSTTRRFTPSQAELTEWLVLVGNDSATVHWVRMPVPDENFVRRLHHIPEDIPILIGRP